MEVELTQQELAIIRAALRNYKGTAGSAAEVRTLRDRIAALARGEDYIPPTAKDPAEQEFI